MAAAKVAERGSPVSMGEPVVAIHHSEGRADGVTTRQRDGVTGFRPATAVISSLPIRELLEVLDPPPPAQVVPAGRALRYRDFLTVALILRRADLFRDNWIYTHEPGVQVGRIQNFKNWSPDMAPAGDNTCIGMEYFCFEGDGLWNLSDHQLVALASQELSQLGFCQASEVIDGVVVRQPKAYPVCDEHYQSHVLTARKWLEVNVSNLWCVGRNGMHKYNNQDQSMMTALIAARRILGSTSQDPWLVNGDAEYHEEQRLAPDLSGRQVPVVVTGPPVG